MLYFGSYYRLVHVNRYLSYPTVITVADGEGTTRPCTEPISVLLITRRFWSGQIGNQIRLCKFVGNESWFRTQNARVTGVLTVILSKGILGNSVTLWKWGESPTRSCLERFQWRDGGTLCMCGQLSPNRARSLDSYPELTRRNFVSQKIFSTLAYILQNSRNKSRQSILHTGYSV